MAGVKSLCVIYWILNESGFDKRMATLAVGYRSEDWATIDRKQLAGEVVKVNQRVSIDQTKQVPKHLIIIRAIRKAGGKLKVKLKSGGQGVTWTSLAQKKKIKVEVIKLVHTVLVYRSGK